MFSHEQYFATAFQLLKAGEGGLFAPNQNAQEKIRHFETYATPGEVFGELGVSINRIRYFREILRRTRSNELSREKNYDYVAYRFEFMGYAKYGFAFRPNMQHELRRLVAKGFSLDVLQAYGLLMAGDVGRLQFLLRGLS